MTDPTRDDDREPAPDNVMGLRKGKGPDQYAGRYGGGESGGGAYANPHTGSEPADGVHNGQVAKGYYGGGQAGPRNDGDSDHYAASRRSPVESDASLSDHPSQQGGKAKADFNEAIARSTPDDSE